MAVGTARLFDRTRDQARPVAALPVQRGGDERRLRRRGQHVDAHLRRRHTGGRGLRRRGCRPAQPAVGSEPARPGILCRRAVPFGAVEPRRRPVREARRGDRQRRERGAVRTADRAARRTAHDLPALRQLAHAAQGSPVCAAHAAPADALSGTRAAVPHDAVVRVRRDAAHAADETGASPCRRWHA